MPSIITPTIWTQQPQYPAEIDWGNPLCRGLQLAIDGRNPVTRDATGRFGIAASGKPVVATKAGVGQSFAGAGYAAFSISQSKLNLTNQLTLVSVLGCSKDVQSSGSGTLLSINGDSSSFGISLGFYSNREIFFINGQFIFGRASTYAHPDGEVICGVFNDDANTKDIYVAGVNVGSGSESTSISTVASAVGIGAGTNGTGTPFNGRIYLSLIFNRALSPAEIKSLSDNPWQIFRPITRRIYVDIPAASGVTYTLTAGKGDFSLTGNDATLTYTQQRTLTAEKGTFNLTGNSATFQYARKLIADRGQFALTGNDASLQYGLSYQVSANKGDFVLTGNNATLAYNRKFSADKGQFLLTGNSVNLNYGGANDYTLNCGAGQFSMTGQEIIASKTVQEGKRLKFWTGTEWKA